MPKKKEKNGICRLCKHHKLLRESHILSEFLHDEMYDSNHQIAVVSQAYGGHISRINKGRWEYLLCDEHENFLNTEYETYASDIYRNEIIPRLKNKCEGFELAGIDYDKFKLFQLSLIWRMSVSSDEAFTKVNLGPDEEIIRKMLLAKDPGKAHEYGVIMASTKYKGRMLLDGMTEAKLQPVEGMKAYSIFIAGIVYTFFISNGLEFFPGQGLFLSANGCLTIPCLEAEDIPFLFEAIDDTQKVLRKNIED